MDYKEKVIALLNDQELSKEQKEKLENIFPELKEKETEDDRIKKALTEFLKNASGGFLNSAIPCETFGEWLAWLEKQGNKSVNIDVESMVSSYEQRLESQGGTKYTPLVNMCLTSFRHGVENVLEELNLKKLEKQGEKKPADKVESKFKVGDKVTMKGDNTVYTIGIIAPDKTCWLKHESREYGWATFGVLKHYVE